MNRGRHRKTNLKYENLSATCKTYIRNILRYLNEYNCYEQYDVIINTNNSNITKTFKLCKDFKKDVDIICNLFRNYIYKTIEVTFLGIRIKKIESNYLRYASYIYSTTFYFKA